MKTIHLAQKSVFKRICNFAILLLIGFVVPTGNVFAQVGTNLIRDPGLENSFQSTAYWIQSSTNSRSIIVCSRTACGGDVNAAPRTGNHWAWFGGYDFTRPGIVSPEIGDMYQYVTFPTASCDATLRFYLWIGEAQTGSDESDVLLVMLDGQVVFSANATQRRSYSTYKPVSIDVSSFANGSVRKLEFFSRVSRQKVSFNVDDLSLVSENCNRAVEGDYNGDAKKDLVVYRPSNRTWYVSSLGEFLYGAAGDIPVPADYNGDIKTEIAVYRPSNGTWYIRGVGEFPHGLSGDVPVPADYNGDGKADIAVFRPSNGTWYISVLGSFVYGQNGDIPVPGDYNGDGKAEIAVYRPSNGTWYVRGVGEFPYGLSGDVPVPADYDGDGKADIAVFRPSNGTWYISVLGNFVYGQNGDIPVPGDYNGDGKAGITVFRPSNGTWYIQELGTFRYGTTGDIPL